MTKRNRDRVSTLQHSAGFGCAAIVSPRSCRDRLQFITALGSFAGTLGTWRPWSVVVGPPFGAGEHLAQSFRAGSFPGGLHAESISTLAARDDRLAVCGRRPRRAGAGADLYRIPDPHR